MNGYSSHTYMWLNVAGERFWMKYHFKTDQGVDFLTQEDADRLAGPTVIITVATCSMRSSAVIIPVGR